MSQLGRRKLGVKGTDASGRSKAGERFARAAETSSAMLPGPPPIAPVYTRTRRKSFILGVATSALVVLSAVGFLVYSMTRPEPAAVPEPLVPSPEATLEESPIPLKPGFDVLALGNGWTRFVSQNVGFSIELPPGWGAAVPPTNLAPGLEFMAFDGPTVPQPGDGPLVFVAKDQVHGAKTPRQYFDNYWLGHTNDPGLLRQSKLTETQLSHGSTYVFTSIVTSEVGRLHSTIYGRLQGSSAYTLLIIVPIGLKAEYEEVLIDIANTLDVTP